MTQRLTHIISLSRRTLLKATSLFAVPSALWATPTLNQEEKEILIQFTRLLFPHSDVPAAVYENVVQQLLSKNSGVSVAIIKKGIAELDSGTSKWLKLTKKEQIAALEAIEPSEFFQLMRENSLATLYRDPHVWQVMGYEGSAIEHGGYTHRGFNDIDWLSSP